MVDKRPKRGPTVERKSALDLPHYIARLLAVRTLTAFCALVAILQMVDLLDRIPEILEHGVGLAAIGKYTLLRLPAIAQQSVGISVLIGGVFAFAQLARNSEVVVMRAAGVSIFQVFKMALPVALLVAAFAVVIIDQVAPAGPAGAVVLVDRHRARRPTKLRETPRWFRVENDVVLARGVSSDNNELLQPTVYQRDGAGALTHRLDAASATARARRLAAEGRRRSPASASTPPPRRAAARGLLGHLARPRGRRPGLFRRLPGLLGHRRPLARRRHRGRTRAPASTPPGCTAPSPSRWRPSSCCCWPCRWRSPTRARARAS